MKRLFPRCMMLLALLVMGVVTAFAQKSVLNESFESGTLPSGWTTAGSYWQFSANKAQFNGAFENAADTLVTPVVSLNELTNVPTVTLAYSLPANGSYVNTLQVLYRETEQSAWAELTTLNEAAEDAVLSQALPAGLSSVQIGIAVAYKLGGITYLSNVRIANKAEATAAPTGLHCENLTTTSVTLWWDASKSQEFEQYNVKVSTTKLDDPSNAEGDVLDCVGWNLTDEFYELANLTPNTDYWLYVQYDCGYGDLSPWAEWYFKTPCEAISAPFYEDFEDELSGCYAIAKDGTADVSSEYPYNSTRSFKFVGSKGKNNYLFLPELNGDAKNYQVSFMAAAQESGNTYARTITVGVATDQKAESFAEVATFDLPKGRTWENIIVSLKGYAGTGKYIAFRVGNADKENRLFIDDIRIEAASSCPKPMFVQVSEITPNSAKLAWTKTGNETEWNLVLSTKPLNDPEDIEPDAAKGEFAGSISANPYTLSNLLPNTTYYAYLQAGCGSSEWTSAVEFKTAREVTYPYSEHFDRMDPELYTNNTAAIPNGWVMDDRGNNSANASYYDKQNTSDTYRPYVTTKQNHEATAYVKASLLLKGTSGTAATSTNYTSIAIAPAMPKPVKTMMVTFWAYASAAQTLKVGVANTQTNDLPQGDQLGANITEVGEAAISGGSEWKQYKVLLTGYTGTGRYIAFYLKPGTSTPSVYIDDIEIDDAPDCNAVSTVTAEAIGIDKATVEWTDASKSTSWTIKVSSTEIDPAAADGDIVAAQTVNAKNYNLTGLAMGQTYYIYVSPTCGDAWKSTTVTTLVGLQVPYYNDFTDETTGAVVARGPKNWTLGYTYADTWTTSSSVPHVNTTAWTNAPADVAKNSVYFNNSTSESYQFPYAIMPELLNGNVKDMKIGFYAYWNNAKPTTKITNYACVIDQYYGVLKIGVVSSPADINKANKFTKVTEVAAVRCKEPKSAEYFVVDMSKYTGSGKYIVFYQDTAKNNYMMIDNLTISLATDSQPVTDVEASEITQTGAKLTWTENGKAAKWEVRVFDAVQEDPAAGTPAFSATVTAKEATITGLKSSTKYFAYVRSIQDNGNGAWGNTTFRTECGISAVPYIEDWEGFTTGTASLDESCYTYTAGAKIGGSSAPSGTPKTGNVIQLNATSTNKEPMIVFPALDKPIKTLQLTMVGSSFTSSYVKEQSYLEVGVLEDGGNFVVIGTYQQQVYNQWEEYFVNFGSYTGEGGRIALRAPRAVNNKDINMCYDNVVIEEIPLCGKITTIEVENIDSVSANISWAKGKAENKWNLKVSSTELDDPATATADIFDGQLDAQNKALTGLDGNTTYYVYVQSVDEALACTGAWSNAKVFKTLCKKQTFPYEEDFEGYPTGSGSLPDCSTLSGQDPDHSYITTRGTGNLALYLKQVTKDHNNYFAFPALNVDSVKRLQLSMQVAPGNTTATNYYYYEVGVMTDPNDPSTFVSIAYDSVQGAANYPFSDKMYTFEGYTGDEHGNFGTYIALKPLQYKNPTSASYYAGNVYIDNVTIDFIETCFKPVDLTSEIGIDTVKLSWNSENEGASYLVRLFADADDDPDTATPLAETTVTDKEAVIRGLTGHTTYYAYVQALCSASDKSKWSSVYQFKTECPETRALPYEEGFDGDTDPLTDYCWTSFKIQGSSACTTDYLAKASTYAKKDGTRGLYLQYTTVDEHAGGSCVGTHRSAAITPALDVESLKQVLLYFDIKSYSTTIKAAVKIEAVSDETMDAEAIYVTTIENVGNSWQKAYVNLSQLYTSAQPFKRLRFSTTTATSAYIDNLVITNDLNVVLPVEDLKLQMLSESTIKFSFTEFTPTINQWQVAYVVAGGDIADATIQTIDTKEYTITGLSANTTYDIYVRGNVDGDQWVGPLTATTIQSPAPLPLITGFEDEADNALWTLYNVRTVQGAFYPNFFIVGDAAKCEGTDENALFITNDSVNWMSYGNKTNVPGQEVATSSVWAVRNINIAETGTYRFRFRLKQPGNAYDNDGAYVQLIPAGATFKASTATLLSGETRNGNATTNANGCYTVMGKTRGITDWTWVNTNLDIEEAGIYTLAIYWYNSSSADAANLPYALPLAVDSVIVEEYLCTTPKNFEFVERKARTVTVEWFGGKCKDFEYVVSKYANLGMPNLIDAEDKIAAGTINNGPQLTISGLLPNSAYSLYVRTICPDGETDWVEYDFETPCALEVLPYTESFTETPECWILKSASPTTVNYKTPEMETAEKWTCLQLNSSAIAILQELNVDLMNVEIELALFNSLNLGAVHRGVIDNTWDASTFQEIAFFQTVNKLGSSSSANPYVLETFSKMLNLYQGTGKVLAIKNATSNAVYVKYVKLTELPDCVKPQQVELTFIKDNEVTVNWLAGLETAWEIMINDSIIENVTTNPYKLTNLEQGTVYTVAVRALCDENSKSEWSLPATFQTACGVNALPMNEDFSALPNPTGSNNLARAALTCWDNLVSTNQIEQVFKGTEKPFQAPSNIYAGQTWVQNWLSALGDYAQLQSYHGVHNPTYRYKWFISPQYAIEGNATLSFDVRRCGNKGQKVEFDAGRFFVAISTDNGATWKKEDATQITEIDTVYSTKTMSLDQYAGKAIRVAFYDENNAGSYAPANYLLIDNVRMNCTQAFDYTDNACEGVDYEGYGFSIKVADQPLAGEDSTYTRFAVNAENGCDSVINLTLTTRTASPIVTIYEAICQGESYDFGGQALTQPNPAGQPYLLSGTNQYGCDSTVYLYLTVNPSDTADIAPVEVYAYQLPYQVDENYTIPVDAQIGNPFTEVVKIDGCNFNRYFITVLDNPTGIINLTADVDYIDVYDALGRKILTLRHGDSQNVLPVGVYMLRTTMTDGQVVNSKLFIK